MKRRITFVHQGVGSLGNGQIDVQQYRVRVQGLKAAREDRFTLGYDELPHEARSGQTQNHR